MRRKLLLIAAVVISCFIVWGIVGTSIKIRALNEELEKLYWIEENTHSSFVGWYIDEDEAMLGDNRAILAVLITALVMTWVIMSLYRGSKQIASVLFMFLLTLTTLTTTFPVSARVETTGSLPHYYAGVRMFVPANPPNGDLIKLIGKITPMWNEVNNLWVAYHIGVGFLDPKEWFGCGYITEIAVGRKFYIESYINGKYEEILGENITFYEKYYVKVMMKDPDNEPPYWCAYIFDSCGCSMIPEVKVRGIPMRGKAVQAIAEGESIDIMNSMSAEFSTLMWETRRDTLWDSGFWEEWEFPCIKYETDPYVTNIVEPYYKFNVIGGGTINDNLCTVQIMRGLGGTTTPPAGFYKYPPGKMLHLQASPIDYFMYWLVDGVRKYKNPTTVVFGLHHLLIPYFYHEYAGGGNIWHLAE